MYVLFSAGNPVKLRDGPAAVSEDEGCITSLHCMQPDEAMGEGRACSMIHESEYLTSLLKPLGETVNPRADIICVGLGFFLPTRMTMDETVIQ